MTAVKARPEQLRGDEDEDSSDSGRLSDNGRRDAA